jgi:RNA polymerase sigma-70 factor (ECF subfamily)
MAGDASWPATRPSLLLQLRNGCAEDAWGTFVALYAPLVFRYCRLRGLQDADAEDVTQEVLLKVRHFEYDPERGRFRGWLATVTGHAIERVWRQANRNGRPLGGDGFDRLGYQAAAADDLDWDRLFNARVLEMALERIRPEFRPDEWQAFLAVALRVEGGADDRRWVWGAASAAGEVARAAGQPVEWVYKVKHKAFRRLREEVRYLAEEVGLLA